MIAIMYDGLELGKFVDNNGKLELKLNNGVKQTWLPYIFDIGMDAGTDMNIVIKAWMKERVFPKNRFGSRKMLKELGLKKYDVEKIAEATRCSLVTDPYWMVYEETDTYNEKSVRGQIGMEYYPYNSIGIITEQDEDKYIWRVNKEEVSSTKEQNYDEENIIEWKDKKLVMHDFVKSHANGGRLEKFWVEDIKTGRQFLIKGSSYFSYEPYCEKMAYIIGRALGIDVLEYDILSAKQFKGINALSPFCKHVSICEKIDRVGYSITSVAEIKRAKNVVKRPEDKAITNKEVMYDLLEQKYIETMLFFDAIIGNVDRHYGNVHLLRDLDGNFIGAPILDNGASLLAQASIFGEMFYDIKIGEHYNMSCTIANTHEKQIKTIEKLKNINFNIPAKTIEIVHDIQPVLNEMPRFKGRIIKKYIVYRLHKYLGMLKRGSQYNSVKLKPVSGSEIKKEKEHT